MSKEEDKQQPATLELRLIDVNVHRNGFRPSQFTVTTTMTDDEQYCGNWIRSIYESRWLVEERKTGTFYFFGFLGRPRGRSEDSSPSWTAVDGCHVESPKGVPRERL